MDEESISKRVNEFGELVGKLVYKGFMDGLRKEEIKMGQSGNFDEMPVNEAIKFLDEYSEQVDCDKCTVESKECANHGCPLVRSVNAIKKEYEEKNAAYEIFMAINRNGKPKAVLNISEEQLEDIKAEMCDDYCCKRKEWTGDPDELIDTVCADCPLTQL